MVIMISILSGCQPGQAEKPSQDKPTETIHSGSKDNTVEFLPGIPIENHRTEIKKSTDDMSDLDKKLQISLNYFYKTQYDQALKETEKVLELESNNIIALKRKGSCYYALGDTKKAMLYWEKASKYNPSDKKLKSFVEKLKTEYGPSYEWKK